MVKNIQVLSLIQFFFISCSTIKWNKRNNKRFNNRGYSLFFLMGVFLKHLWLVSNILKWQDCNIFTNIFASYFTDPFQKQPPEVLCNFLKRDSNTGAFVWNFEFLRTFVLKNICQQLLLPFPVFTKFDHNVFI